MATIKDAFPICNLLVVLLIVFHVGLAESNSPTEKIYVQGSQSSTNCSYNCKGSLTEPFDSLAAALKYATTFKNASVEILLFKAPHHFVLFDEVKEETMQENQSSRLSSSSSYSSVFTLPVSVNITIRPAICIQDVYVNTTQGQSNSSNCYQTGETANIVIKSFDFQIVVQSSLILRDLNFIGSEDISVFNSYNNQTSVNTCLSNRIHCCTHPEAPLYSDIKCTGHVTIRQLTSDPQSTSVFFLNQTQTNIIPQLMFNNCNFQRISLTKKKNFIALGTENSHNLKISSSNFSEIFTPYGLIGVCSSVSVGMSPLAEPSKMLSQSIEINKSVFSDFNPNISFVLDQDSPDSDGYILNMDSQYGGNITVGSNIIKRLKGSRQSATSCLGNFQFSDPLSSESRSSLSDFANKFASDHYFNTTSSIFRIDSLSGSLTMRNNLFYQNIGKSGTVLSLNQLTAKGSIDLTDNTFDGNFATTGFPTVRISASISNYFDSSICGNVIINGNTFRNHLTCRNGYGNLMLFCGTIRSPSSGSPVLSLSEALDDLFFSQQVPQYSYASYATNTIYADTILPRYYRWNNLRISNNLFEKNLIQLSNSIAIFGGSNVEIINNTFSENGVPFPGNHDFHLQSSYFSDIIPPKEFAYESCLSYLTTTLLIEQTKDMSFSDNLFKNNWNLYNMSEVFPSQIYLRNVPEFFSGFSMFNCTFRDMTLTNDTTLYRANTLFQDSRYISSPLIGISYVRWPDFLTYFYPPPHMILGVSMVNVTFENNNFNFTNLNQKSTPHRFSTFPLNTLGVIKIFQPLSMTNTERPKMLFVQSSQVSNNKFHGTDGYVFSNTDFSTMIINNTIFRENKFMFFETQLADDMASDITDSPSLNMLLSNYLSLIVAMSSPMKNGFLTISYCTFSHHRALLIYGYSNAYVQIQNTNFYKNQWHDTGLILGTQSTFLQISQSNFTKNSVRFGVIVLQSSQIVDSSNLFYKNTATVCNCYFLDNVLGFEITDTRFIENSLRPKKFWLIDWHVPLPGNIWLIESRGIFTRTHFQKNLVKGGLIHMKSSIVSLNFCSVLENIASGGVGLAYISSSSQLKFLRTNITKNEHYLDPHQQFGRFHAGMLVVSSSSVVIEDSNISYNVLGNGSGFLTGQDVSLGISNAFFLTNYDLSALSHQGSTFLIYVSYGSIAISDSHFSYNGQLLKLIDGVSYLNGNMMTGFQFGLSGTQILIDVQSGSLSIKNNQFYQTTGGLTSLLMLRAFETDIYLSNSIFDSIIQGSQPMFKVIGKSSVMRNLTFKDITSTQAIVSLTDMHGCKMSKIYFSCGCSLDGVISAKSVGNLTLKRFSLCHNAPSNILQVKRSNMLIMQNFTVFRSITCFNYHFYSYYHSLPLMKLEDNLKIVLIDVHIKNQVTYSANLYIATDNCKSTVAIVNSTFESNQASQGGAITFVLCDLNAVNISNTVFINNTAIRYSESKEGVIETTFMKGGALKMICSSDDSSLCDIDVRNCTFENNRALAGGAIYWEGYPPLVEDNKFKGNIAVYGPELASKSIRLVPWTPNIGKMVNLDINKYIEAFRAERSWPDPDNLALVPDNLDQYSPEHFSEYSLSDEIDQLSEFITQEIYRYGFQRELHMMKLSDPDEEEEITQEMHPVSEFKLHLSFTSQDSFESGSRWKRRLAENLSSRVPQGDNSDKPAYLLTPFDALRVELVNKVHNQQSISISNNLISIENVVSGAQINQSIALALLDVYGQIVSTNNNSLLNKVLNTDRSQYSLTIQGANVRASSGILEISGMIAEYYPGSSTTAAFGTDQIESLPEKLRIVNYFSQMSNEQSVEIEFSFRDCIDGEYFEASSNQARCSICKENTFVIEVANNSQKPCSLCDKTTMICLGGSLVAPAAGYWRLNQTADIFLACPIERACLGGWNESKSDFSYDGFCAETYRGPLCSKCEEGYAKYNGGSPCVSCRKNIWQYFRFAITVLLEAVFIILNVKTNLFIYENHQNENFRNMRTRAFLLKMLTNYLQVVSLIEPFSFSWPGFLKGIFNANGAVNASSGNVFAVDCLIYLIFGNISTSLSFVKATIALLLPVVFGFFLFLFWGIYFAIKTCKNRENQLNRSMYMNYVIGSTIIVAFNLQPMVLKYAFILFECRNIYRVDSPLYHMAADYDVRCWTSSHMLWVATSGVLTITLWGIIVPLIIFINIRRAKKSILKFEGTKALKYCFIVFGYREKTYYWEFVILIRKYLILIIVFSVTGFSRGSQFILILLVIAGASLLHNHYQPYESPRLNQLETLSLFSIELFVMACLYYSSVDRIHGLNYFVIILCTLGNAIFLLRWFLLLCKTVITHLRRYAIYRKAEELAGKLTKKCNCNKKTKRQGGNQSSSSSSREGTNILQTEQIQQVTTINQETELHGEGESNQPDLVFGDLIGEDIVSEISSSIAAMSKRDYSTLLTMENNSRSRSNSQPSTLSSDDFIIGFADKSIVRNSKSSRVQTVNSVTQPQVVIEEIADSPNYSPDKVICKKKVIRSVRRKQTVPIQKSSPPLDLSMERGAHHLSKSFNLLIIGYEENFGSEEHFEEKEEELNEKF